MQIGLVLAPSDQYSDINQHLQLFGCCEFVRFDTVVATSPWPDGVYLVDWTILQPDQRQSLLHCAQHSPCTALIIFAPILSGDDARRMLHGGVADILNSLADKDAIAAAVQHQISLLDQRRIWMAQQQRAAETLSALTPREKDILRALRGGASNKVAARLLGISPRTVEVHRANILRRTDAASIADVLKIQQLMDEAGAALRPSPALMHSAAQPCRRDLADPSLPDVADTAARSERLSHHAPCAHPTALLPEHRRLIYTAPADRIAPKHLAS